MFLVLKKRSILLAAAFVVLFAAVTAALGATGSAGVFFGVASRKIPRLLRGEGRRGRKGGRTHLRRGVGRRQDEGHPRHPRRIRCGRDFLPCRVLAGQISRHGERDRAGRHRDRQPFGEPSQYAQAQLGDDEGGDNQRQHPHRRAFRGASHILPCALRRLLGQG